MRTEETKHRPQCGCWDCDVDRLKRGAWHDERRVIVGFIRRMVAGSDGSDSEASLALTLMASAIEAGMHREKLPRWSPCLPRLRRITERWQAGEGPYYWFWCKPDVRSWWERESVGCSLAALAERGACLHADRACAGCA